MAFNNSTPVFVDANTANVTNRHAFKMRNKRMWKSLRSHILSRREKRKQDEADAEILRKKKYAEDQKIQENKLSLAQINGRLSELRDKRDELEEEKRELLIQKQTIINTVIAVPEPKCANYDRKLVTKIKFKSSIVSDIAFLHHQQQQQQQQQQQYLLDILKTEPCMESPTPILFEELNPKSESVVIPTNVKESSEPNHLIIDQPN